MHELSISINILNSIQQYADENSVKRINEVTLKIGKLQAVVEESLKFMYDCAKTDYPAAKDSFLSINFIDIKAKCNVCNEYFIIDNLNLLCPKDNNHTLEVVSGNELMIESLDIDK